MMCEGNMKEGRGKNVDLNHLRLAQKEYKEHPVSF